MKKGHKLNMRTDADYTRAGIVTNRTMASGAALPPAKRVRRNVNTRYPAARRAASAQAQAKKNGHL